MRNSPVDTTDKAVSAALVGLLFVLFDFAPGGIDVVPDVFGWALLTLSAAHLRQVLAPAADGRLGTVVLVLSATMTVINALVLLLAVLRLLGLDALYAAVPLGLLAVPLGLIGVLTVLPMAALSKFVEGYAQKYGADPTTLKVLKAGWVTGLVTAAAALLVFLGILPFGVVVLVQLATLATGILVGVGLARCRNEGVVG